ncbi:MAG: ATP-dependent Clp protease ATP-binding subunit [Candidatus Pacebacteria bacterium]|nr:ATP-dependent Clp protease ATP-binding subunit [Candidatus Paceibacterota bacterium]
MAEEFNFNLKKTAIYRAIKWARNPVFKLASIFGKLFLIAFIILFPLFLYGFLTDNWSMESQSLALGFSIISLSLFLICRILVSFLNSKVKNPSLSKRESSEGYNLADFLSFEAARVVLDSINFARRKKLVEVNSTLLFYFLLSGNREANFIFLRALLSIKQIKNYLKNVISEQSGKGSSKPDFSEDFKETIVKALKVAQKKGHTNIETGDLMTALAEYDPVFKNILIDNKLKVQCIEDLAWWLENLQTKIKESKRFWEWKNLVKKGSMAKQWTSGYTITLDRFSIDLSEMMRKRGFPETIGHKKEIAAMERILARWEMNNVLIVGESGSGRKSMIYEMAKRSAFAESMGAVNYKRFVQLDLNSLLAQVQSSEEVEATLDNIFREVLEAGNVVLVIDDFHNFVGGVSKPGVIDISGVISSYLIHPAFQIIAITTFEGLHKSIEQNSSILSLFEKVEVSEVSEEETLMLLEDLALRLEFKSNKFVSHPALRDIIVYCSKYLPANPFPEKAMELLDEAIVYLSQTKDKILLPKHIAAIVFEKTQIPVGEIEKEEKQILLNLESLIHQRIINQEEAVKEVSTALRRARSEISVRSGPMGTFLFFGPTGVGKTETSKALAEIYFGSEEKMIRLDMSEFQSVTDIPRLIGSAGQEGLLTTKIRERPFSLILLDEIEKAHPNVLNLFLQVLDEGHLTDGLGRKVDFKNSIIIATSNAGYQIILKALQEKMDWQTVKQKILDYLFGEGQFRPEFINRFDAVVVFKPLSKENLLDIADLMLKKLQKNLKVKEIELVITGPLKERLIELGYNPTFGARELRRTIQDKVENVLASAILSGRIQRGSKIEINPEDFSLVKK